MTHKRMPDPARRALVQGCLVVLATGPVPLRGPSQARADPLKLQKSQVQYTDKGTVEGRDCDDCVHFVAGKTADAPGTCKIVEGAINPHGHCAAFTPLRR